jgi:hypothetical protein
MNKINIHKLERNEAIEQSFYEDEDEAYTNPTRTPMGDKYFIRQFTDKSMISVDVENINNYFIKEFHFESDRKYGLGSTMETDILRDMTADSKRKNSIEGGDSYFLTTGHVGHRSIFEEFLTIGVETEGLEYTDLNELYLTPKILANYPNNLAESELKL